MMENIDPLIPVLLERLKQEFEARRLTDGAKTSVRYYSVAGLELRAEIPDEALADMLLRAFEPLRLDTPRKSPDLIWRAFAPEPDLMRDALPEPPYAPGLHGSIFAGRDHQLIAERQISYDSILVLAEKTVLTAFWSAQAPTLYAVAKPLLRFLYLLLYAEGRLVTHAALVGRSGKGVLVTGRGGSGKSTTAAVSLLRGLDFVSDDYVSVRRQDDAFVGEMMFASLMLDRKAIARFPALNEIAKFPTSPLEDKALIYPALGFANQLCRSMEIAAIVVPVICGTSDSRLVPVAKAVAMRALAPSSVYSSPWRETSRFDFYHEMIGKLPCYRLELGSDIERVIEPLEEILR